MAGPATKLGSLTAHGGTVIGPGCPTVLIEKTPAIRVGSDMHLCPMVTPGTPPVPHVGMNNIGPGVPTVLIGKMPASTMGDNFLCVGPPAPVVMGATTVIIGTGGGGSGGGGGAGSAAQAKAEAALKAGTVSPVEGTEAYPIDLQATALVMQEYCTSAGQDVDLAPIHALAEEREQEEEKEATVPTIADFVEILEKMEQNESYDAARAFAGHLNYEALCELAKAYVTGESSDEKNNPDAMPTRYMLLYGADDDQLQEIDNHHDVAEGEEHKISVSNLRKALILQGSNIEDCGAYDDEVYGAYLDYYVRFMGGISSGESHFVRPREEFGGIARMYNLPSWKSLYKRNKDTVGDNPDFLNADCEVAIPQFDLASGEQMITDKGVDAGAYVGGVVWRYPWQSCSISFVDDIRKNRLPDFEDEREFRLAAVESGETLASGTITRSDEVDVLVPDLVKTRTYVDGLIIKR